MEGLIHVGLWKTDVVLETSGDRFPERVDNTKGLIALLGAFHNDPEGDQIIDLFKGYFSCAHLSEYTVEVFGSSKDFA